MSATTSKPPTRNTDQEFREEFQAERRNRAIVGVAVLVLGLLATFGILYFFGAASAVGW